MENLRDMLVARGLTELDPASFTRWTNPDGSVGGFVQQGVKMAGTNIFIDEDVLVSGSKTTLGDGVKLRGKSTIYDSTIAEGSYVKESTVLSSVVGANSRIVNSTVDRSTLDSALSSTKGIGTRILGLFAGDDKLKWIPEATDVDNARVSSSFVGAGAKVRKNIVVSNEIQPGEVPLEGQTHEGERAHSPEHLRVDRMRMGHALPPQQDFSKAGAYPAYVDRRAGKYPALPADQPPPVQPNR